MVKNCSTHTFLRRRLVNSVAFVGALVSAWFMAVIANADESDYYKLITIMESKSPTASRAKKWRPSDGLVLEASGLASLANGQLAVAIRKGEVWILDGIYSDPPNVKAHCFAKALHEPLGLLHSDGSLYVAQRSELTKLRDTDGDEVADEYLSVGKGWGVTGNYHEYAYGPVQDREGNFLVTLNVGMGDRLNSNDRWRGWAVKISPDGKLTPFAGGMRSPAGIGTNLNGDVFFSDQQGNWVGSGTIHHLQEGAFYGNPDGLTSAQLPGSPLKNVGDVPSGLPWPKALNVVPQLKAPAVWLPYKKMGQSATDIVCDTTAGKFGPFAGQLFVGEFRLATVNRVFLEKVAGQYQGACFPFRQGFSTAVVRLAFGKDGSMFAGLTNRGWSSLGHADYGLQRIVWTGKMPFEIREMRAKPDGFELSFTRPVDSKTAADPASYSMSSYTYHLQKKYGSDEILIKTPTIRQATVAPDGLTVQLQVAGLRAGYVHELRCEGIRSSRDEKLLHDDAYYTLNAIPRR